MCEARAGDSQTWLPDRMSPSSTEDRQDNLFYNQSDNRQDKSHKSARLAFTLTRLHNQHRQLMAEVTDMARQAAEVRRTIRGTERIHLAMESWEGHLDNYKEDSNNSNNYHHHNSKVLPIQCPRLDYKMILDIKTITMAASR